MIYALILLISCFSFALPLSAQTQFDTLIAKAEKGDIESQAELGSIYSLGTKFEDGVKVEKNFAMAEKWLLKAAAAGNLFAHWLLSKLYLGADEKERRYIDAVQWLERYVQLLMNEEQILLMKNEKISDLRQWLIAGNQFDLGMLYYQEEEVLFFSGQIVLDSPPNPFRASMKRHDVAIVWFREAAERGHKEAQYVLGHMYQNGMGSPQNYLEAIKWYRLAAEAGERKALFHLGELHKKTNDPVRAHMWFNLYGSDEARMERDKIEAGMTIEQTIAAQKHATEWAKKHSKGPKQQLPFN